MYIHTYIKYNNSLLVHISPFYTLLMYQILQNDWMFMATGPKFKPRANTRLNFKMYTDQADLNLFNAKRRVWIPRLLRYLWAQALSTLSFIWALSQLVAVDDLS